MTTDARMLRPDDEGPGEPGGVAGIVGPSIGRHRRYLDRVRGRLRGSPSAKDRGDVPVRACPVCGRARPDGGVQ